VAELLREVKNRREVGDVDAALAYSRELVRSDPSRENYGRLAEVLRKADLGWEVVEVREKMLKKFGPDRELRRKVIDAACDYGFPEKVEEMWLDYCSAHPGDSTIRKTMVYALRGRDADRKACRLLARLAENVTEKEDKAEVLAHLARCRRRTGELEQALESYREAIRLEPKARPKAYRLREAAEMLDDLGRAQEARAAHKKTLAIDPGRGAGRREQRPSDAWGLAGALERIDNKLAKIERDVFDKRKALFKRVEILRAMDRNEEALQTLARIKKSMESHPRHFSHRGQYPVTRAAVLYDMGRYAKAKAIIEDLLQDPDSVQSDQRAEIKTLHDRMHTELLEKEGK
jgi:tetratricopeptide (TPR) repeat protein